MARITVRASLQGAERKSQQGIMGFTNGSISSGEAFGGCCYDKTLRISTDRISNSKILPNGNIKVGFDTTMGRGKPFGNGRVDYQVSIEFLFARMFLVVLFFLSNEKVYGSMHCEWSNCQSRLHPTWIKNCVRIRIHLLLSLLTKEKIKNGEADRSKPKMSFQN